jgi:GDP-4-dehydro-6-deoxy-D-mannose reductase
MSNILITGISGFTGSHLVERLINSKDKIYGTIRGRCRQTTNIDHIKDKLTLLECDFTDYNSVQQTIEESEPDYIYHLGAQTFVPTSWRAPQETMNSNVLGTLNLLEAIRKSKYNPKILIVGSSEEYGQVEQDEIPIKETNPLRPISPYAVSKVAQDLLGFQYNKSYGLKTIRTRAFNLIGPRSAEKIVSANLAIQFLHQDVIYVGNLDTIRDFNDVRDVARAYELAIEKGKYGDVYNISTGEGHKIREIVDIYSKQMPGKCILFDKTRVRPSDVSLLVGDSTKFNNLTGWKPYISFESSVIEVLHYWSSK